MKFNIEYKGEFAIPEGLYGKTHDGITEIHFSPNSKEKIMMIKEIKYPIIQVNASINVEGGCGYKPSKDDSESIQGESYIYCDLDGNSLEYLILNTKKDIIYTTTCYPFIKVHVKRTDDNVNLVIYKIDAKFPKPDKQLLLKYDGNIDDLEIPELLNCYNDVVDAVIEKSYCVECKCFHYYNVADANEL
jgi:hypothetical protein